MPQEQISEELDQEIKADSTYAQILIKMADTSKGIEDAKKIIKEFGVRIIQTNYLSSNNWVLFKLDVSDMRNLALKLTESGYSVIKGINALTQKT